MKKKIKQAFVVLASLLFAAAVSGCGSSAGGSDKNTAAVSGMSMEYLDGGIYDTAAATDEAYAEEGGNASSVEVQEQATGRKLIKNVDMSVETEEFDTLIRNVERKVTELGGYVEQSNIYNGSYTSDYRSRSASITARIPADRLDQFLTDVAEQSNVTRKNEYVEDVTLQYVDLESHKKALLAEQESLLTMLENAESIDDIIRINEQLTDVRYQIESMESQLRTYDNRIDYSTVYLDVDEVEQYEPYVAKSAGERISEGFVKNLRKVGNGIVNFGIEFIISIPILLVIAVVIGIVVGILYLIIRKGEKKAEKRRIAAQERARQEAGNPAKEQSYAQPGSSARYRTGNRKQEMEDPAKPKP